MNATAKIATPVEVLARLDTATRVPVLFLRSTIDSKGNIKLWRNGEEEKSTVDFYGTTVPLSAKDEKIMRKRFADAYGIAEEDVVLNKRLPRTPRERQNLLRNAAPVVAAPIPAIANVSVQELAKRLSPEAFAALVQALPEMLPASHQPQAQTAPVAAPATNGIGNAPALALVHPAPATATEAAPAPAERRPSKKQRRSLAAKKAAATRAANRAGGSKTIEAQPAPPVPQGQLPEPGLTPAAPAPTPASVAQASPGDVMAAISALGQEFNSKLTSLMETLAPKSN